MNNNQHEPKLVLNDYSQRYLNVQPFFNYLHEFRQDDPKEVVKRLEWTIRFLSENFDKEAEPLELKNAFGFLFELKDVFDNLAEFRQD